MEYKLLIISPCGTDLTAQICGEIKEKDNKKRRHSHETY